MIQKRRVSDTSNAIIIGTEVGVDGPFNYPKDDHIINYQKHINMGFGEVAQYAPIVIILTLYINKHWIYVLCILF